MDPFGSIFVAEIIIEATQKQQNFRKGQVAMGIHTEKFLYNKIIRKSIIPVF